MLFFHGLLTIFLIGIFFFDLTKYIIPNWMTGTIIALWPVMLLVNPVWPEGVVVWQSLAIAVTVFVVGIGIFVMHWAGGGDVKLLAALALWTGRHCTIDFLVYTGLLGGVLVLICLLTRPLAACFIPVEKAESIPRILRDKEPVPYGVAISTSFLILLWMGEIPGLPVDYALLGL